MNLAFDTTTIEKLALDYKSDDQCKMLEVPHDLSRERFDGSNAETSGRLVLELGAIPQSSLAALRLAIQRATQPTKKT